jgi:energy-coupling factor transporter ATP-binding protein EcfA2
MILESVEFFHLGPFEPDAVIRFEPGLTVLVGPNDAGKSRVLRYLELMLNRQPITEDDLPTHYRVETPWDGDPAIRAVARFRVTDTTRLANNASDLQPHDVAVVEFRLAPKQSRDTVVLEIVRGGQKIPLGGNTLYAEPFPVVTQFPTNPELRPVMHLDDLRREELMLLRLAFGPNPVPVLRSFSSDRAVEELHEAGEKISARLNQYLPENLRLEFILSPLFDDETLTSVLLRLRDRAKARVGLQRRGSGLQKLLGILIAFLSDGFTDRRRVLLLDEPETHLHPNGQHALRYYLEELSQHPNLQVIYATHSSAMVNPFKASSIRVVERVTENDRGRSVIREEAVDDNFLLVRTSLGVSPLDSLLYAPVCLLVEGPTEAHVLPRLLRHALDDAREPVLGEGMSIEQLLAFCHIVSGGGSNWPKWVRLIESQRAHAVVFVDGDMAKYTHDRLLQWETFGTLS